MNGNHGESVDTSPALPVVVGGSLLLYRTGQEWTPPDRRIESFRLARVHDIYVGHGGDARAFLFFCLLRLRFGVAIARLGQPQRFELQPFHD